MKFDINGTTIAKESIIGIHSCCLVTRILILIYLSSLFYFSLGGGHAQAGISPICVMSFKQECIN